MIEAFNGLSALGWRNIVLVFLFSIIFVAAFVEVKKLICDYFGIETKWSLKDKARDKKIENLEADISKLQEEIKNINENRTHDREQSFKIQGQLTDLIKEVSEKQDCLIERVDALAEQNRKYELDDIRETLLQAYRYYTGSSNPMKAWTEMEAHAFWEQYQNYVDRQGNGYIKGTVAPAMHKLNQIPLSDLDKVSELMESRHR